MQDLGNEDWIPLGNDSWIAPVPGYKELYDSSALRTIPEMCIRTFAIHIASSAAFGHLLSLRYFSRKRSALLLLYIIGFVIFPTIPLAQLLRQVRSATSVSFLKRRLNRSVRYFASTCLGMHIIPPENGGNGEALVDTDPSQVQCRQAPYNILWLGRMIILIGLLVQYCGTILLYVRRLHTGYRVWSVDTRNFEITLGGFIVVVCSLGISLLNTDWSATIQFPTDSFDLENRHGQETNRNDREESRAVMGQRQVPVLEGESFNQVINTDQASPVSGNPHPHSRWQSGFSMVKELRKALVILRRFIGRTTFVEKTRTWYLKFRGFNFWISQASMRCYPQECQWDLELAYLLRVIFLFLIQLDGTPVVMWSHETAWRYNNPVYLWWSSFTDVFYHAGFGPFSAKAHFIRDIYLFPFLMIMLHCLLWIAAYPKLVKFVPHPLRQLLDELDFWLRSGRTVISIPLQLLIFVPQSIEIIFLEFDFRTLVGAMSKKTAEGKVDFWTWQAFWKDPLSEQLYIV
jgi:hypothetical protein